MSGPGPVDGALGGRPAETAAERDAVREELLADLRTLRPDLEVHRIGILWVALPKGTRFETSRSLPGLEDKLSDWPPGDVTARPSPRGVAP